MPLPSQTIQSHIFHINHNENCAMSTSLDEHPETLHEEPSPTGRTCLAASGSQQQLNCYLGDPRSVFQYLMRLRGSVALPVAVASSSFAVKTIYLSRRQRFSSVLCFHCEDWVESIKVVRNLDAAWGKSACSEAEGRDQRVSKISRINQREKI